MQSLLVTYRARYPVTIDGRSYQPGEEVDAAAISVDVLDRLVRGNKVRRTETTLPDQIPVEAA